ncbi:hypothetical protein A3Q56_01044 [Intoshia linei]|uniref:Uncharacterized protein n=1 Tax=Intoshia linei TaxID=1819745 RepID=A0A177BA86_9BILA|nr:hypothetical protein A3Q56_01044 [Intoshia linei]
MDQSVQTKLSWIDTDMVSVNGTEMEDAESKSISTKPLDGDESVKSSIFDESSKESEYIKNINQNNVGNKNGYTPIIFPFSRVHHEYGIPIDIYEEEDVDFEQSDHSENEETIGDISEEEEESITISRPAILNMKRDTDVMSLLSEEELKEVSERVDQKSILSGECGYCHEIVKKIPSDYEQLKHLNESNFCCEQYRNMLQLLMNHPIKDKRQNKTVLPDQIVPKTEIVKKKVKNVNISEAKPKAKVEIKSKDQSKGDKPIDKYATIKENANQNVYPASKQYRIINYQLSSQKCLDNGWTMRPPSPLTMYELKKDYDDQSTSKIETIPLNSSNSEGRNTTELFKATILSLTLIN